MNIRPYTYIVTSCVSWHLPADRQPDGPLRAAVREPGRAVAGDGGHDGRQLDLVDTSRSSRLAHAGGRRRGRVSGLED